MAGHLHRAVEGEGEGRHAFEGDRAGLAVLDRHPGAHQAAGALDVDAVSGAVSFTRPVSTAQRPSAMTAWPHMVL